MQRPPDDSNKTSHPDWYALNIGIGMASSHPGRLLLPSTGSCVLQQTYAVNNVQSELYHNFLHKVFFQFLRNCASSVTLLRHFSGSLAGKTHSELQWYLCLNTEAYSLIKSAISSAGYTKRSLCPFECKIRTIPPLRLISFHFSFLASEILSPQQ